MALENALPRRNLKDFRKYLPPGIPNTIHLRPASSPEIISIIREIKNTMGNRHVLLSRLIKENLEFLAHPFSLIFIKIISSGCYPDALKIALFKAGDKTDPNNYRPISLLPLLNKIFEKLMHKCLATFLEAHNVFMDTHFGFRKNKSTHDAVNNLLTSIYKAFDEKVYLGAVFIDLSKAFDTVPHNLLLKKLEPYGIRGVALDLIESYLSNRKQYVTLNGVQSTTQDINIGVPQGSVLGPLLFLMHINDLPNAVRNLKSILFADDTTLFTKNKNAQELCATISDDMLCLKEW